MVSGQSLGIFCKMKNGDGQESRAWDEEKKIGENLLMLVLGLAAALEQK